MPANSSVPSADIAGLSGLLATSLLPVGVMMSTSRIILQCNDLFADAFGYRVHELRGESLEVLYPSYREFRDIGNRWLEIMRVSGQCGDERIMRKKDGTLIWMRAKGRCKDRSDPYALVTCSFEPLRSVNGTNSKLTAREREIVFAIGQGLTSKEIARQLKLSPRTIETYRARLMEKFQARNVSDLFAKMRVSGAVE